MGATSTQNWVLETTLPAPDTPGQSMEKGGGFGALGLPRALRTTLRPQSHSSPGSTKWFPQVGLPVRSWGSGTLERHQPWPCCRLRSRSCRLQLLKLKPGVNLQSQEGACDVGKGLGPSPPKACPLPSPRRRCHDAATVVPEVAAVAEAPGAVVAHAQVVPQLMGHGGGDDEDTDGVVLWDRRVREGRWWENGVGGQRY